MTVRNAEAVWEATPFEGPYSFRSRVEDGPGISPEELIGAEHAETAKKSCPVSVALAGVQIALNARLL